MHGQQSTCGQQPRCDCSCCTGDCPNRTSSVFPANIFSNTGSSSACTARLCNQIFPSTCPASGQAGEVTVTYLPTVACPSPPPPCLVSGHAGHMCECQCCIGDECPNSYFISRYPASLMSHNRGAEGCSPALCRLLHRDACPAASQAGEVHSSSYVAVTCPPPPPPALCAEVGGPTQVCECQCCSDASCQAHSVNQMRVAGDSDCTPAQCSAQHAQCGMDAHGGAQPHVRAVLGTMPPCPAPPPLTASVQADESDATVPVGASILIAILAAMLVAAAAFVTFIRHRELKGEVSLTGATTRHSNTGHAVPRARPIVASIALDCCLLQPHATANLHSL